MASAVTFATTSTDCSTTGITAVVVLVTMGGFITGCSTTGITGAVTTGTIPMPAPGATGAGARSMLFPNTGVCTVSGIAAGP